MKSMPIGEKAKIGRLNPSATQKRLRISRTIDCMSFPEPWPISWAMASFCALPRAGSFPFMRPDFALDVSRECPRCASAGPTGSGAPLAGAS